MQYEIEVEWTGSYPNLCSGEWLITINGKRLGGVGNDSMDTYGCYDTWSFGEDWIEEWEEYQSGKEFQDWKYSLPNNLEMSLKLVGFNPKDETLIKELYEKLQEQDWRHNSCGGCI